MFKRYGDRDRPSINCDRIRKIRSSRLKNVAEQASDENAKTA
ncbi:hypothetical protein [Nostoc sp. 'Peltigera membranacea cyanobiont' 210A]|nr:hypothetical protein [Nostoc sp. 'Peltigera membranacea cyanobiont' 210A]